MDLSSIHWKKLGLLSWEIRRPPVESFLPERKKLGLLSWEIRRPPVESFLPDISAAIQRIENRLSLEKTIQKKKETICTSKTLKRFCMLYGRNSEIVQKLCKSICAHIAEQSEDIKHVYAAYNKNNNYRIFFVTLCCAEVKISLKEGHSVFVRVSSNTSQTKDAAEMLSPEEARVLKNQLDGNAETLMKSHRFITGITGRKRTVNGKSELFILMNAHPITDKYTHIPIGEEKLPSRIGGFPVVVRNGCFQPCSNKPANEYHENVKMGCQITSTFKDGFGTIGGFIDHPVHGICGLTCAHVLYKDDQLLTLKKQQNGKGLDEQCCVYQPSKDKPAIGRVVQTIYKEGGKGKPGIDVAVFKMCDRIPKSGQFPYCEVEGGLEFDTGKTYGKEKITFQSVLKYGAKTNMTTGIVIFEKMAVRTMDFHHQLSHPLSMTLFDQLEVSGSSGAFCRQGDSGALVFTKDILKPNDLVCIGIVEGIFPNGNTAVSPIEDILEELQVQGLLPFRHKEEALERLLKIADNRQELRSLHRKFDMFVTLRRAERRKMLRSHQVAATSRLCICQRGRKRKPNDNRRGNRVDKNK